MSLSAAAVFAPFVRAELLQWDPLFTGPVGAHLPGSHHFAGVPGPCRAHFYTWCTVLLLRVATTTIVLLVCRSILVLCCSMYEILYIA